MQRSESLGKLAEALALAQGKMKGAAKDAANPFFKSRYADLASCWEAARAPLAAHGLSILQPVKAAGADVTVTTILAHASGEWLSEDLSVTAKDETPQSVGSAITYARRYGLSAMVGISPEDDDGNGAQPEHAPPPRQRQQPHRPPPQQPDQPEMTAAEKAKSFATAARDKQIFDDALAFCGIRREEFHAWAELALGHPYGRNTDWSEDDRRALEGEIGIHKAEANGVHA
jgi:hypothetical protein